MGDYPCQLGTHGDQEGFLTFVELAPLLLLDDQYPHHTTVMDDGGAQERCKPLFAGFGKVTVARVGSGVFQVERLFPGAHQAHQALVGRHADLADGALVEAFGRHQHEAVGFRVEQVNRADLAAHGFLDTPDNDPQRRLEIFG